MNPIREIHILRQHNGQFSVQVLHENGKLSSRGHLADLRAALVEVGRQVQLHVVPEEIISDEAVAGMVPVHVEENPAAAEESEG
jgi:hypothetical protein